MSRADELYDGMVGALISAFYELHPADTLPHWFGTSADRSVRVEEEGAVTLAVFVWPFMGLGPNERWGKFHDSWVIYSKNPGSEQESIVISRSAPSYITLFKARIDGPGGRVGVIENCDLSKLSVGDIEHPPGTPCWFEAYKIAQS